MLTRRAKTYSSSRSAV